MKRIKRKKQKKEISKTTFGKETFINLYSCNPKYIKSKRKITEYAEELCKLIKVKPYGKPIIKRFALHIGHAAGYSLVQLIESSLVSAHFSELWSNMYLNIFSCKDFDERKAIIFSQKFFEAKKIKQKTTYR